LYNACPFNAFNCLCAETQKTRVEYTDLSKTTISEDLKRVNTAKYTVDPDKKNIEVVTLSEQNYKRDGDLSSYGLYIYIYNPKGDLIMPNLNKIELASNVDSKNPWGVDGTKYNLTYINRTSDNTIYKFKVNVDEAFIKALNSQERIYNIVGIELYHKNGGLKDYPIGGSYKFTGYQRLYADDTETIKCVASTFQFVELDLRYTTYRNTSKLGLPWKNQLTSVYFAIPNYLIEHYGVVYGIEVDYEKYYTKPIVVIDTKNNEELYEKLSAYEGKILEWNDERDTYYNENIGVDLYCKCDVDSDSIVGGLWYTDIYSHFSYNLYANERVNYTLKYFANKTGYKGYNGDSVVKLDCLPMIIPYEGVITDETYISQDIVSKEIEKFRTEEFADEFLSLNGESFSKYQDTAVGDYYNKLAFEEFWLNSEGVVSKYFYDRYNTINSSKVHTRVTLAIPLINMEAFEGNWWQKFQQFGFKEPEDNLSVLDIKPVEKVLYSDISNLSAERISTLYCVEESEVDGDNGFYKYVEENSKNDCTTYLFRIGQDLYRTEKLYSGADYSTPVGFYVQEHVYMGFDVVDLLFVDEDKLQDVINKDSFRTLGGQYSDNLNPDVEDDINKVPVVNTPTDIVGGLESPPNTNTEPNDFFDFGFLDFSDKYNEFMATLKKFIMVIMGVFVFILILPFLIDGLKLVSKSTASSIRTLTGSNENRKTKFKRKK